MGKNTAERQAAYRARRQHAGENGDGERHLNCWISTRAALALERIAIRYCVTKREMIERFIVENDERILSSIDLDSTEWNSYFSKQSLRSNKWEIIKKMEKNVDLS